MKRNDAEQIGKLIQQFLRQELMMGREVLIRTLNQRVGATVITNIIFR